MYSIMSALFKRNMTESRKKHVLEIIIHGAIIFASYILAIFIRYHLMKVDPGINALSMQYLLIALVYSFLLACTFEYKEQPRYLSDISSSTFRMLFKSAIGCLILLSFFYFAGVIHFSRWALFLFWFISSGGLIFWRIWRYGWIARRRCDGKDGITVLLVGEGKLAEDYIRSIRDNEQFGIRIAGYVGDNDGLEMKSDRWFSSENNAEQRVRLLGNEITAELLNGIDEIVITDVSVEDAIKIMGLARSRNIPVKSVLPLGNYISSGAMIRNLGMSKVVLLNEVPRRKFGTLPMTGIAITIAALFLIIITQKFEIGAIGGEVGGFGTYRNLLFAALGFFMFLKIQKKGFANILKRTGICLVGTIAFAGIYEAIYGGLQDWKSDLLVIATVIVGSGIISLIQAVLEQDDFVFIQ